MKESELRDTPVANLDDGDIHQVSLGVAHLVLSIATATKQIHDHVVLGFHIGWLWRQIFRVVFRQ
jgi:hypothetical protein